MMISSKLYTCKVSTKVKTCVCVCGWKKERGDGVLLPDVCDRGRPPWMSLDPVWFKGITGTLLWLLDNYRFRPTSEGQITSAWKTRRRNVSVVKPKVLLNIGPCKYVCTQSQKALSTSVGVSAENLYYRRHAMNDNLNYTKMKTNTITASFCNIILYTLF